jgi:predicted PurR-regulated permease PerM
MAPQRKTSTPADPFKLTLVIFAIIAVRYFAGEVLRPLALSVLLSFALAPGARLLERFRLPGLPRSPSQSSWPWGSWAGSATSSGSS